MAPTSASMATKFSSHADLHRRAGEHRGVLRLRDATRGLPPACGVTVEGMPRGEGQEHLTTTYRWFLARWARQLSWKETTDAFRTPWDNVFRSLDEAFGFQTETCIKIALFHVLGRLPVPEFTHRFC